MLPYPLPSGPSQVIEIDLRACGFLAGPLRPPRAKLIRRLVHVPTMLVATAAARQASAAARRAAASAARRLALVAARTRAAAVSSRRAACAARSLDKIEGRAALASRDHARCGAVAPRSRRCPGRRQS